MEARASYILRVPVPSQKFSVFFLKAKEHCLLPCVMPVTLACGFDISPEGLPARVYHRPLKIPDLKASFVFSYLSYGFRPV
jgi:hypothetical protein